ncbi:acetate--CoA ligase family protein [bacterium]|nr:acetate--CoA ligase family protein [bacterium]
MMNLQLLHPKSIVVVGGSNDIHKPGGKVLKNLIDGKFSGKLYVTNPKEKSIQGISCHTDIRDLPDVDLAIIAIAAKFVPDAVKILTQNKNTRAFIVLSAGFSEVGQEGKQLEDEVVRIVESVGGVLIGPNSIGVLTPHYHGVFTQPIPKLNPKGCDLISGSGATAVFILEAGIPKGLTFSNIFSVGNCAQIGVEEILKYLDESFDSGTSSMVKLLYIEKVDQPQMLLKHALSLIQKGCRIAAIKAGSSEAGSRAASSHTGALASSDTAVDALFRKAGIVRCFGREDLINVACVFMHPVFHGKNIAVITHAGGPAVMVTDALSKGGMSVPKIEGHHASELLQKLFPGSSVNNPIDFLATGTAEQLEHIIDYVETHFEAIDAMVVIFGTPGLVEVFDAYEVIHQKKKSCQKPIFSVLPSTLTAKNEVDFFLAKGEVCFPDEVLLAQALCKVSRAKLSASENIVTQIDEAAIRRLLRDSVSGYLKPGDIKILFDAAGIPTVKEATASNSADAVKAAHDLNYPIVMKAVGPIHKTDIGGISLHIGTDEKLVSEFDRLMKIRDVSGVLIQPMLSGIELFIGAKYEPGFGHVILCGLGGIFVEVLKDVSSGLSPLTHYEALDMIRNLEGYKLIKGIRGQAGADENVFADIIVRLSDLLMLASEIQELDINPLLGRGKNIIAVDARVRIEKN